MSQIWPIHPVINTSITIYGNLCFVTGLAMLHISANSFIKKNNCTIPRNSLTDRIWTFYDTYNQAIHFITGHIPQKVAFFIRNKFDFLKKIREDDFISVFVTPIEEELHRYAVQELLLRKIPKYILSLTFPEKTYLVDSPLTKVLRISLFSINFALIHTRNWGKGPSAKLGISSQFLGGLSYGTLLEYKSNIYRSILLHAIYNLYCDDAALS